MHEDKVSRLRQLLAEAVPRSPATNTTSLGTAGENDHFTANDAAPLTLDMSPRSRAIREIMRIATWHNARPALIEYMDRIGVSTLKAMQDHQIESTLEHMRQLENCILHGLGSPYAPPAA